MMDTVRIFSEYIQSQIQQYLPEKYQEADCRIQEVLRNNGVYGTAMEFHIPGENTLCSIHMDLYYAEFKQGKPIAEIMKEIVIQIQETYEIEKLMKENHIEDFQCMKPYLKVSLVNTGRNRQRLLGMPYMEMEDLSIICRVEIPSPEGYGRVEVTNDMLKGWGISKGTLFDTAFKNMQESRNYIMQAASPKMCELFADAPAPENLLEAPADAALDGEEAVELTSEEHCIFTEYLDVKDRMEQLEREYHYYLGLAVTAPLRQAVQSFQGDIDLAEDDADERKDRILDLLAEGRIEGSDRVFQSADIKTGKVRKGSLH